MMNKPQLELHPSTLSRPGGIQGIILPHGQQRISHREAHVDKLIPGLDVNGQCHVQYRRKKQMPREYPWF